MWYGIILEGGSATSSISTELTTLRDAQFAISNQNNNYSYDLRSTSFINNYIGILCDNFSGTGNILGDVNFIGDGNTYGCTGSTQNLLPAYHNQGQWLDYYSLPPALGQRGFAGIYAIGVPYLYLGNSLNYGNIRFENLSNGIVSYKSNLVVNNSYFYNMIRDHNYEDYFGNPVFGGCGIYCLGGQLNQTGLGRTYSASTTPYTFINCRYAIVCAYSDIADIRQNCSSNNVMNGVYFFHTTPATTGITIKSNNWNCKDRGIWASYNNNANILIEDNFIILPSGIVSLGRGIYCEEYNQSTHLKIYGNDVWVKSTSQHGIWLNGIRDAKLIDNYVHMTSLLGGTYGYKIDYGSNNILNCNTAEYTGTGNSPSNTGFGFSSSDNNKVIHNTSRNAFYGFLFRNGCSYTDFDHNEIYAGTNSSFGLRLQNQPTIGTQTDKGNEWHGIFNIDGAWLSAPPFNALVAGANQFIMNVNIPINNYMGSGVYWFTNLGSHDPPILVACDDDIPRQEGVSSLDSLIAGNSLLEGDYAEQTTWIANMHLYEKLQNDTSLFAINPLFRTFYESRLNGNVGRFVEVQDQIDSSAKWESLFEINYVLNTGLINLYTDSIRYLDSLIKADPANSNYNYWQFAVESYPRMITDLMAFNDSLFTIMDGIRLGKQEIILESNDSINPDGIYELNEQIINGIYLTTIAQGIFEFTNDQVDSIYQIAWQCPFIGGPAVYSARSLYGYMDDTTYFDDDLICISQGIAPRLANKSDKELHFSVYPNPAKGKATLTYELDDDRNGKFILYNSLGEMQVSYILDSKKQEFDFDTSSFANGVYYFFIKNIERTLFKGKLVLIR